MKKISIEESKKIQIAILDEIDSFCKQHSLSYSLACGSLLGAVRHKGFIPWDDDIDIMMPRNDYNYFIRNFKSARYECQNYLDDPLYFYPWAKVFDNQTVLYEKLLRSGVNVDIFPIDGLPSIDQMPQWQKKWSYIVYHDLYFSTKTYKFRKGNRAVLYIKYLVKKSMVPSRDEVIGNFHRFLNETPYGETEYAGAITGRYGIKDHMPLEVFKDYTELEFEDKKYMCISRYDKYLSNIYGDYMKLPPVEKRIPQHDFIAHWK